VPLETNGIRLGSLLVYARSRPDAFDAESLQVLQALADLMAVAVQNARLFAERQQQHAQRRRLLERLIWTQEEERKRIARDLHDELGQSLTALRLALESVRAVIPADLDEAHRRLDEARDLTGAMLADLRRLMLNLRPSMLDDLGLRSALRWYVQAHLEPAGLKVQLDVDLKDAARLPPPVETALYRIVQEAGTNILRHAQATTVRIGLTRQAERIRMVIEDDGRGFDPARVRPTGPAGLGLLGMTERALSLGGTLWIESRPGAGTRVHVELPCASPEAPA
jgi:signal transduction histidine kinase